MYNLVWVIWFLFWLIHSDACGTTLFFLWWGGWFPVEVLKCPCQPLTAQCISHLSHSRAFPYYVMSLFCLSNLSWIWNHRAVLFTCVCVVIYVQPFWVSFVYSPTLQISCCDFEKKFKFHTEHQPFLACRHSHPTLFISVCAYFTSKCINLCYN